MTKKSGYPLLSSKANSHFSFNGDALSKALDNLRDKLYENAAALRSFGEILNKFYNESSTDVIDDSDSDKHNSSDLEITKRLHTLQPLNSYDLKTLLDLIDTLKINSIDYSDSPYSLSKDEILKIEVEVKDALNHAISTESAEKLTAFLSTGHKLSEINVEEIRKLISDIDKRQYTENDTEFDVIKKEAIKKLSSTFIEKFKDYNLKEDNDYKRLSTLKKDILAHIELDVDEESKNLLFEVIDDIDAKLATLRLKNRKGFIDKSSIKENIKDIEILSTYVTKRGIDDNILTDDVREIISKTEKINDLNSAIDKIYRRASSGFRNWGDPNDGMTLAKSAANLKEIRSLLSDIGNDDSLTIQQNKLRNLEKIFIDYGHKSLNTYQSISKGVKSSLSIGNDIRQLDYAIKNSSSKFEIALRGIELALNFFDKFDEISRFLKNFKEITKSCTDATDSFSEALSINNAIKETSLLSENQSLLKLITNSKLNSAAKEKEASATVAVSAAQTAQVGTSEAVAAAQVPVVAANKAATQSHLEVAAAEYMAAHAYIPFAGFGIGAGFSSAATALVKSIGATAFAEGGIVSGPTLGLVGEYAGAKSNPEVIAPLNRLKEIIGEPAGQPVIVGGRIVADGRNLAVVLENYTRVSGKSGHRNKF